MDFILSFDRIFGVGFLLTPLVWYWWHIIRTRHWPTTDAQVFETSDGYSIQYTVDEELYEQMPDIESNIRIGGIKVYKKPTIPEYTQVRYNPYNPNDYTVGHAHSKFILIVALLICITVGLSLILK